MIARLPGRLHGKRNARNQFQTTFPTCLVMGPPDQALLFTTFFRRLVVIYVP